MKKTKDYLIPFVGLKLGKHHFEYKIDNKFFEVFDYQEFKKSNVTVNVILEKKSNMLELNFNHKGTVNVPCDVTGEDFDLPIKSDMKLIVRFGEFFDNNNEELLILPFGEFQIDVAQYIYEMIVLAVPLKRVSLDIKKENKQPKILDEQRKLVLENKSNKDIDPRWEKLKQLLTDK